MGTINSFQNLLDNIFLPLFEVTVDPASHPQLHVFLEQAVGMDLVDDESKPERRPTKHMPTPEQWTNVFNPAYAYYVYYCYANLYTLNKLRESKGMTTIKLRPHCGEAGDVDHLAAAFLTAHNIAHGVNLKKSPVLQYLYYLAQYSYELLLQYLQKTQALVMLGIINERITFEVSPGQPSLISDDADVVALVGTSKELAKQINQKEVHWGEGTRTGTGSSHVGSAPDDNAIDGNDANNDGDNCNADINGGNNHDTNNIDRNGCN